jgi:hypothetical protein
MRELLLWVVMSMWVWWVWGKFWRLLGVAKSWLCKLLGVAVELDKSKVCLFHPPDILKRQRLSIFNT